MPQPISQAKFPVLIALTSLLIAPTQAIAAAIQGGVDNSATLQPSVRVIPGAARTPKTLDTGLTQYSGSQSSGPGALIRQAQSSSIPSGWSNNVHVIPAISSVTSRNGIMTFDEAYAVTPVAAPPMTPQVPLPSRTINLQRPSMGTGITTFEPGYEVSRVYPPAMPVGIGSGPNMTWLPGYAVTPVLPTSAEPAVTASLNVPTVSGNITPANGIVSWVPGYEATPAWLPQQFTHDTVKSTLGGLWSTSEPLSQRADQLQMKLADAPMPKALSAEAKLLPGAHIADTVISWNEWYKRVGNAIWERWADTDTGPGIARIRCVVKRDCNLNAQVEDFIPAEGVERDVMKETEFRVAANRAVLKVDQSPVLTFPFMSNRDAVVFEIDMKRTVDGPARCDVVSADTEIAHK